MAEARISGYGIELGTRSGLRTRVMPPRVIEMVLKESGKIRNTLNDYQRQLDRLEGCLMAIDKCVNP